MHTKPTRTQRSRSARQAAGLALALALPVFANIASAQEAAPAAPASNEDETVIMSPFSVDETKDSGYKASNSIAGTRTNTPIKEIPLNIQVFTKDLTDDLAITNHIEVERYNAALVNGNADSQSDNAIQQAYNAFIFRGFIQNWGIRDGIRQYDPLDTQGLARIEIVKGPAAPLYGLAYPGGVMNSVSKEVDFKRNFADIRLTAQSEGGYRASLDANMMGKLADGKFGVRYNAAYAKSQDERDHSEGNTNFQQVQLNWQPAKGTEIKFLAESSYRDKPNGLGYFSRGETNSSGTALGNGADIPLQIVHPEIPWTWNWAVGNMRTAEDKVYRGTITQTIENLTLNAYVQFADKVQVDSDGWDASGGGGSAASWDLGWSADTMPGDFPATGWMTIPAYGNTPAHEVIRMTYHHRDWNNSMHSWGGTAVYKFDVPGMKNIVTAGTATWKEKFLSTKKTVHNGSTDVIDFAVAKGIKLTAPDTPPASYYYDSNGGGKERSQNSYYFASWQGSLIDNRLRLSASANHTTYDLKQFASSSATTPNNITHASKWSPMFGAMFDVTKEVSVFLNRSTSLFPTTDKNSFLQQMPAVVGKSIEGGVKVELLNGKISGTISYYKIDQTGGSQTDSTAENFNTQLWDTLTPTQRATQFPGKTRNDIRGDLVAGGKQESKGYEADLVFQPTKEWQVVLSYAHNDQKVVTAINPATIGQSTGGHIKDQVAILSKYSFREGSLKGLFFGLGMQSAGKALQDYSAPGGKPRFNPSTFYAETFVGYKFKTGAYQHMLQLNLKNITEQDAFTGWKATGSSSVYATERYRVPTSMTAQLTYGFSF